MDYAKYGRDEVTRDTWQIVNACTRHGRITKDVQLFELTIFLLSLLFSCHRERFVILIF